MRTTNERVLVAWAEGQSAYAPNMGTDGKRLYSYGLCIGERLTDGRKVVFVFTPRCLGFVSKTTRIHVGEAKPLADVLVTNEQDFVSITGVSTWDAIRDAYNRWTEIMKNYSARRKMDRNIFS